MVIEGIYDGVDCFITSIEEVRISDIAGERLQVKIQVGGPEIFNETYYASGNTVKLYEVGEILRSHFVLPEPRKTETEISGYVFLALHVTMTFTDGQDTEQRVFYAFYNRCHTSITPSDVCFLNHENIIRTTTGRMEYLSYLTCKGLSYDIGIAHISEGKESYKTISEEEGGRASACSSFSIDRISQWSGIAVSSILYYDVMLKLDGVVKDKVRFVNDDRRYRNVTNFIYLNAFGLPETMTFTGLVEYAPELEGDLVELTAKSIRANAGYIDSRTVNSGYLSVSRYAKALDLVTAEALFLYDAEAFEEVVVTDIDFSHKRTGSEKINVSLTFKKAARLHASFKRTANVRKKIFDKTFDYTFE